MKLNGKACSLTCGILWGVGLFLLTWWMIFFDGSTHEMLWIGKIYRGYNISPTGSLIGLAWAFPDGLIGGLIFAWLYNHLAGNGRGLEHHTPSK